MATGERNSSGATARAGASIVETVGAGALAKRHEFGGNFDLVFLDADHSFEGVTADLAAWEIRVKAGGWIGGHDYRNPDPRFRFGVTEAVDAWAERRGLQLETDLNFTWFARL